MKSVLPSLLLMLATVTQPLLAVPATCSMPASGAKMACASCCHVKACCAPAKRAESSPVNAVVNHSAELPAMIYAAALIVAQPLSQLAETHNFAIIQREEHSPSPRALSCIQLI